MKMTNSTKIKLIMPLVYAASAATYFIATWPNDPKPNHYLGTSVSVVAFMLWVVARLQLGNAFSIGPKADYLVTSGLYSKLRHPVYYFSILAAVGIGIYTWTLAVVLPVLILVCLELYRMNQEEKVLTEKFGEDYIKYKAKTWL